MWEAPVYIDFDDVLCETARGLLAVIQEHFGRAIEFEQIHSFDLALSFGLDETQLNQLMQFAHKEEILAAFDPVPGAIETLCDWSSRGADIWIVTGRPPLTEAASVEWLRRHGVPYSRIVFVDKYGRFKADIKHRALTLDELRDMPFALAIDDAPQMVRFLDEEMGLRVAMLDRPWNRCSDADERNGVTRRVWRCGNWRQIAEYVKRQES